MPPITITKVMPTPITSVMAASSSRLRPFAVVANESGWSDARR